jgi:quercetin dioxygenase-like cupin family protein
MSGTSHHRCDRAELVGLYALRVLPASEASKMEGHLSTCRQCRRELETLQPVLDSLAHWPTDVLRPDDSLWDRLIERIGAETTQESARSSSSQSTQPEWEDVSPGISCKILAGSADGDRVSMLVRLAPGAAYPPHRHSGVEELHLLDGELWIDGRKLYPGDYSRAEAGTADQFVWSEAGCTCVLITSPNDVLR